MNYKVIIKTYEITAFPFYRLNGVWRVGLLGRPPPPLAVSPKGDAAGGNTPWRGSPHPAAFGGMGGCPTAEGRGGSIIFMCIRT